MPRRALSPCAEPACPELTARTRCPEHQTAVYREEREKRGKTTARGLGWSHQKATKVVIARQPWCTWCGQDRAEVEARGDKLTGDHIIRRADGGRNTLDNYTTACGRCNSGRQ